MLFSSRKSRMIDPGRALPGRDAPMPIHCGLGGTGVGCPIGLNV